jgi:hypothetical protein
VQKELKGHILLLFIGRRKKEKGKVKYRCFHLYLEKSCGRRL